MANLEDPVPLSEEELRLLDQMERALVEEDPKFASTLRGTAMRTSARRRLIIAGFGFALGITLLFVGVLTEWYVGIVGFVLMLASTTLGLSAVRSRQAAAADPRSGTAHPSGFTSIDGGRRPRRTGRGRSRGHDRAPFMDRMENRWRRRRENGGF